MVTPIAIAAGPDLPALLLDTSLKATVLFALAALLTAILRGGPARLRHIAWTSAVVGVLAVPVLTFLTPGWHVPLLGEPATPSIPADSTTRPFVAAKSGLATTPLRSIDRSDVPQSTVRNEPAPLERRATFASWTRELPVRSALVAVWCAGALACVSWLLVGLLRAQRLARRAMPLTDDRWTELRDGLCADLGLVRRPRLLEDESAATPMTWGWLRPVVLMPADARSWSSERRTVVLLHELMHVRRRDWLTQLLAQLARAVHWFNPLAWVAFARLAVERERACDEGVIAAGAKPSDYASHLLSIALASSSRGPLPTATLAMAHRSQLEGRLMSILDEKHSTRRRATFVAPVLILMAGAAAASASVRTWSRPEVPTHDPAKANAEPAATWASLVHDPAHDGDEETIRRQSQRIIELYERLKPLHDEMKPLEEHLERAHRRFAPLQERLERLREHAHPLKEWKEELHKDLHPFTQRKKTIEREIRRHEDHAREIERELYPFEERIRDVEREMHPIHQSIEIIERELRPFRERIEEIERRLRPLEERAHAIERDAHPLETLREELHHALGRGLGRNLGKGLGDGLGKKLGEGLGKGLGDGLGKGLGGGQGHGDRHKHQHGHGHGSKHEAHDGGASREVHKHLEELGERLAPLYENLNHVHKEMHPLHERLGEIHEEMSPFHKVLERLYERLAPHHERIEHIHRSMAPLHKELERLHERMLPHHEEVEELHRRMEVHDREHEREREHEHAHEHEHEHESVEGDLAPLQREIEALERALEELHRRAQPLEDEITDELRGELVEWIGGELHGAGLGGKTARLDAARSLLEGMGWGWALDPESRQIHIQTPGGLTDAIREASRRYFGTSDLTKGEHISLVRSALEAQRDLASLRFALTTPTTER